MFCPYCKSEDTKVVDKRDNSETGVTRRRRECLECSKRFTTYERIEKVLLSVEKTDGRIIEFDRNKLKSSIFKACTKRRITENQIEELVDDIENNLMNKKNTTVKSREIGQLVLEKLKDIDPIGYVRYVCIFNDLTSLEDIKQEINNIED
jgi:transcriptional repressor NrdR